MEERYIIFHLGNGEVYKTNSYTDDDTSLVKECMISIVDVEDGKVMLTNGEWEEISNWGLC